MQEGWLGTDAQQQWKEYPKLLAQG